MSGVEPRIPPDDHISRAKHQVATPGQIAGVTPGDDAPALDEDAPISRDDFSAPCDHISAPIHNGIVLAPVDDTPTPGCIVPARGDGIIALGTT